MNIIADSLSVKQFDVINGMTVNGLDVKNYIQEQVEDQIQIDTELSNYVKTSALSDYAQTSALTAYAEKTMLSDYAQLSDIADSGEGLTPEQAADIENLKKDVQYLSTLSTEHQLTAAAGSMAYEQKENYLTAVPDGYALTSDLEDYAKLTALADYATSAEMTAYVNQHLTGSADIDLTEYAKKTELSDIPAIKNDVEYLGTLSSEYSLSANAGNLAYKNIEDLEIPTDSTGLSVTKDLSIALGLNYKEFASTSADAGTTGVGGGYTGFQFKLSAFSNAKIYSIELYRPNGTYGSVAKGTSLSVVGSSSISFAGINASNTYIVSDGTTDYPDENARYSFKMKYINGDIPSNIATLFFYFVNTTTDPVSSATVRFNVYSNYSTNVVDKFLHSQGQKYVQLTANTVTTSLAGYVTPSQMESYVSSHSGVSEEVDPKFAGLSSQFLTQQSLDGYATTSSLTSYAEISALTAYAQLSDLNEHELTAEAGSMAYEDKDNYLTAVPEGYARTTELSDIPTIKANIQYLGTLSSTYTLSAEAGKLAYMDPEDLPTPSSDSKVFYDLAEAVPSSNEIHLSVNTINIFAPTAGDAGTTLSVYMPRQIDGHSRDCLLRLDQTSVATSLNVIFAGGSFESEDGEFPVPEANAVNIFSFVETAPNVFDISHKTVKGIN